MGACDNKVEQKEKEKSQTTFQKEERKTAVKKFQPSQILEGYEWIRDEVGGGTGEKVEVVDEDQMMELPHRHIGVVLAVHPCGQYQLGTGILISRNLVLTCAHVTHSKHHQNKPFPDIYFYPRQHGKLTNYIDVEDTASPEQYRSEEKWLYRKVYDYTLLKLKDKVDEAGFLPLSGDLPQLDKETCLSIFGYPESKYEIKGKKPVGVKQHGLKRDGHILDIYSEAGYLVHRISTEAGQSGAPVIMVQNNGTMTIIGIHVGTPQEGSKKYQNEFPDLKKVNLAKLTNKQMIKRLSVFAKNLKGEMFRVSSLEQSQTTQQLEEEKRQLEKEKDELLMQIMKMKQDSGRIISSVTSYKSKQLLFDEGYQHGKAARYNEAVESYRKVLQIDPNNATVYFNIALALDDTGRKEEAVASYQKAIQINPKYTKAYSNMGIVLRQLGRNEEAVTSYKKAIQIDPNFALAYCNMGRALKDLGRFDEAVTSYHKAVQLDPSYKNAFENFKALLLNKVKAAKKPEQLVKFLEVIVAQNSDSQPATATTTAFKTELKRSI